MKTIFAAFLLTFSPICFSQTPDNFYSHKIREFDSISQPNTFNDLSAFFLKKLNASYLNDFKIKEKRENENHFYVVFKLDNEGKFINVYATTPYSELNKSIVDAFLSYDINKLNITDRDPMNLYMVQILSRAGDQMIVNCSSNIIYDRFPVFETCEDQGGFFRMKSCFKQFLENYIASTLSVEIVKKAKMIGVVSLHPRFIIGENGRVEEVLLKDPNNELELELRRILMQLPVAKIPAMRNGVPTKLPIDETFQLTIDSDNKNYIDEVIKAKYPKLSPDNELALHFKKHISLAELNKIPFKLTQKSIEICFSLSKKGKILDLKSNAGTPEWNDRLVEIFKDFPITKLNITSSNVLELYYYKIISKAYPGNIIQCNEIPNIYIPPTFDKSCQKSDSPKELLKCLNESIAFYITSSFDPNGLYKSTIKDDIRLTCNFLIDVDSKVSILKMTAPNPSLEQELIASFNKIGSVYKPAYINGEATKICFTLPVVIKSDTGTYLPTNLYNTQGKSKDNFGSGVSRF